MGDARDSSRSAHHDRGTRALTTNRSRIRYAVVGLGRIAQVAVLPAFRHAVSHSQLVALVSGNPPKRRALAREHRVERTYGYDKFDACLRDVDAVYIALPNSMHAEYAIRAARANVHVLCEKPLATTVEECEAMIDACRAHDVKLMVAYRLHFERITRAVLNLVRNGRIGVPRFMTAVFSFTPSERNIRTERDLGGGSLYDIGVYCINAARHIFQAEPVEALGISVHTGEQRFASVDETMAAVLRFDGGRIASFVTSLNAAGVGAYRIVGTTGDIFVQPGFTYVKPLAYELTVNGRTLRKRAPKQDQFAAQLSYFSDCIRANRDPSPSGFDGLYDVRIVQALHESAARGKPIAIPPLPSR